MKRADQGDAVFLLDINAETSGRERAMCMNNLEISVAKILPNIGVKFRITVTIRVARPNGKREKAHHIIGVLLLYRVPGSNDTRDPSLPGKPIDIIFNGECDPVENRGETIVENAIKVFALRPEIGFIHCNGC